MYLMSRFARSPRMALVLRLREVRKARLKFIRYTASSYTSSLPNRQENGSGWHGGRTKKDFLSPDRRKTVTSCCIWISKEKPHLCGSASAAKLVLAYPLLTAGIWPFMTGI